MQPRTAPANPSRGRTPSCLTTGLLALAAAASGCAATPGSDGLSMDQDVVVEGQVASIDRAPMAYDGDGLLVLSTQALGTVTVHVPARSNLCKAQGLALFNKVEVGARVRATGTVTGPTDITVCVQPTHELALER